MSTRVNPVSRIRLLALCCILACACARRAPDQSGLITLWEQEDASVAPFIDSVLAAFKKLPGNENIRIARVHYGNEDLRQQFLTASIAGNPPDLIISPADAAGVYSVAGFLLPADGLFDLSRYNDIALSAISQDGKTWGVPITNGNHLMLYYNKTLVPAAPRSTDELFDYCAKARRAGSYCIAMDMGEPFWLVPWLAAFGGWPIEGRTPTLDTQAMHDALDFYLDLKFVKKYTPEECDYNCMDALFKEAKTAFIINGDWALASYKKHFGNNLGVAKIPRLSRTGKMPAPMVSGKYFMLSAKLSGEKLALVKRLVEFYTNKDNQLAQVRELLRLPALKEAAASPEITGDTLLNASLSQLLAGRPMPMNTELRAVWDAMRPAMCWALIKKVTVDEAAARMQRDAVSKIKEMNE